MTSSNNLVALAKLRVVINFHLVCGEVVDQQPVADKFYEIDKVQDSVILCSDELQAAPRSSESVRHFYRFLSELIFSRKISATKRLANSGAIEMSLSEQNSTPG